MKSKTKLTAALVVALSTAALVPAPADAAPKYKGPRVYITTTKPTGGAVLRLGRGTKKVFGVVFFRSQPKPGRGVSFKFFSPRGKVRATWFTKTRKTDEIIFARLPLKFYFQEPGQWKLRVRIGTTTRRTISFVVHK